MVGEPKEVPAAMTRNTIAIDRGRNDRNEQRMLWTCPQRDLSCQSLRRYDGKGTKKACSEKRTFSLPYLTLLSVISQ